ncbi:MAG: hypothetical protein WC606_01670 [Candidatus Absconditabacterales bacterium]
MDLSFLAGIVGSVILLIGAAWPVEKTKDPMKSVKNWLFAIGSFVLLLYAIFGYFAGGPVFFIVLELFVLLAATLMMLNTNDRLDTRVISIAGILLIIRSLFLFQGPSMVLFIVAFIILALGYAYDMHSIRRYLGLTLGGALISLSSYLDASRIFFWLNVFFAAFSLIYLIVIINRSHKKMPVKKAIPAKKKVSKKKKYVLF